MARRSTSTDCWRSVSPPRRPPDRPVVTAVIAAAGSGERLGAGGPKAFVPLAGRAMVEWSIDAFRACESVDSILVAAPPGKAHDLAGADLGVVDGGATRAQSVANALEVVRTGLVAVHDAARPLLTPELVEALVALLDADPGAAGAIPAAPLTDTVKRAAPAPFPSPGSPPPGKAKEEPHVVVETLDRSELWGAQTPQLFRTEVLRQALAVDQASRDAATDESMLVERAGGRVLIHPSGPQNLKVTTPLDLRVAELLLAAPTQ